MGTIIKNFVKAAGIAFFAVYSSSAVYLAHQIAKPDTTSLKDEIDWEKEHELWNDFDNFRQTEYIVDGYDGYQLHCLYAETAPGSSKFVIISHGYTSNRYGCVKYVDTYRDLGYNCILYDVRGHGENDKSPCSLGYFEAQDLLNIIEDTRKRFGDDIYLGLHGESMGSSISLNVLQYDTLVRFVVADCGFANLYDLIDEGYRKVHIGFMTPPVNAMMKMLYMYDMKKTSARDALKGNGVPICLIHGADDTFIDPENSEELREATSGYVELHLVEGAGHAQSREIAGEEEYTEIIKGFLEKVSEI